MITNVHVARLIIVVEWCVSLPVASRRAASTVVMKRGMTPTLAEILRNYFFSIAAARLRRDTTLNHADNLPFPPLPHKTGVTLPLVLNVSYKSTIQLFARIINYRVKNTNKKVLIALV